MCGIAGIFGGGKEALEQVKAMARAIAHRGPNGEGFYGNEAVALGHRRLSVIDLEGGGQPLYSPDGLLVLVCNGEIYNYRQIRKRYTERGYRFQTHSDNEVILPLYEEYGPACLEHLDGMFAFALYDVKAKRLFLARDHLGIKPLHLWQRGSKVAFASEMKAFLPLPDFVPSLNRGALWDFFQLRYLPGKETLLQGVSRLLPGEYALVSEVGFKQVKYYSPPPPRYDEHPRTPSHGQLDEIRHELSQAVESQLVADVPIACYLSGGLDSSTVTALAARSTPKLNTFTLGFGEPHDENEDAAKTAAVLGTQHHSMQVEKDIFGQLPQSIWAIEEPKINGVQGFLLARETSKHAKVALSGLGGDELFCGYERNEILWKFRWLSQFLNASPHFAERGVEVWRLAYERFRRPQWDHFSRGVLFLLSLGKGAQADALLRNSFDLAPQALGCPFSLDFVDEMASRPKLRHRAEGYFNSVGGGGSAVLAGAMHHEVQTKLSGDYLLNEDRTSMAHGLEVRVPLLRRSLVERIRRLPVESHFEWGRGKASMRKVVRPWLPAEVLTKQKRGFQVSAYHQFDKGLKEAFEECVDQKWLNEIGLFDQQWIHQVLGAPKDRRLSWHYYTLWMILGLKHWWGMFLEGAAINKHF